MAARMLMAATFAPPSAPFAGLLCANSALVHNPNAIVMELVRINVIHFTVFLLRI
jgi:hypothetical protein